MNEAQKLYNEYKFLVPYSKVGYVKSVLDSLHGNSDPYPAGEVDSIYYDNFALDSLRQCREGEQYKEKFRIRGYGDGAYRQLQRKHKDIYSVSKIKTKIAPVTIKNTQPPDWSDLKAAEPSDAAKLTEINYHASAYTYLYPAVRVKYQRFRYRLFDYRMTLDTNIEVSSFSNVGFANITHGSLPYNVLELKTDQERAYLPFLNLMSLQQISFSKYYIGLNFLQTGQYI